jgi:RHS repeat-associated protein
VSDTVGPYDGVGNRLSSSTPDGTTTYSYDAADELVERDSPTGTVSYGFDADGNEVQAGSRTFAYDLAGRLASTTDGSTTTDYAYDGTGNRLESTVGSDNTQYLWDKNNPLPELAVEREGLTASSLRSYVYGGELLAMRSGGASFFFQHDAIGTVTDVTSSSGDLERHYGYDPFGNLRTSRQPDPAAPDNVVGFAGQLNDIGSGTEYMRARTYDSSTGRFLSLDPLVRDARMPSESRYSYADNRPTALIDPSGMGPIWPPDEGCNAFISASCFGGWVKHDGSTIVHDGLKLVGGCVAGAVYGEAAIDTPIGYSVALLLGPDAAMLLPLGGCLGGIVVGLIDIKTGNEGPNPFEGALP